MRNMLQFVARLLCVAAFLCLGSGGICAQSNSWNVWNGTDKTQPAGWTEGKDKITISTAAELAWVAETVNDGTTTGSTGESGFEGCTITLDSDIDLNDNEWTPIGNGAKPFKGTFDGNNKTIKNLKISNDNYTSFAESDGLFGKTYNAIIEKLTVIISDQGISGVYITGGIVGSASETKITNCCVLGGSITVNFNGGDDATVGGIAGYCSNSNISYCYVNVSCIMAIKKSVEGNSGRSVAGGIVGSASGSSTIQKCLSFTTNIKVEAETSFVGDCKLAGIVGDDRSVSLSDNYLNNLCIFTSVTLNEQGNIVSTTTTAPTNANGAALTTENSKPDGAAFAGWADQGWTLEKGKLPKISANAPDIIFVIIDGTGIISNPYQITSVADMEYIASQINSGAVGFNGKEYYRLENDIDLESKEWTAIGTEANPFKGTFDGHNKTITLGIKAEANQSQAGLFGTIDKGANVEKLAVCVTSEGITSTATGAASNAGAIAAINKGTIDQCYVTGDGFILSANGSDSYAGGIAGSNSGTISNCYNLIPVKLSQGTNVYTGGIVGYNTGTTSYCFAAGKIIASNTSVSSVAEGSDAEKAGGIAGFNNHANGGIVKNCVAVNAEIPSNANRVIGTGGDADDINNFSFNDMPRSLTKAADTYAPLEGTALTKDNANSNAGGCFYGWEAAWDLDAIGTSLPKLKGFDGQKDISIESYLLYTVTINSVSYGTLTVTRPDPITTGGSSITVNNGDQVPYNTELTITATPEDTYEIDKLTVGGKAFTSSKTHQVKDNVTVNATFKKIEYTVNINITGEGDLSITYPNPSTSSTGTPIKVKDGSKVPINTALTITATPASGYELKALKVNGNNFTSGTTHRVADNVTVEATFEAESVDPGPIDPDPIEPDPTPTPPQPTVYYTVTLPSVEGAATDPVAGDYKVESWSNFRFYLTLDSAYNQSIPVVTTDRGDILTPRTSDGAYVLKYVRTDVEIYISDIVKNPDPVANEAIKANVAKVWKANGHLHLQSPVVAVAYIYTVAGNQPITCKLKAGEVKTIQLLPGVYFVRIGDESFKIAM